MPTHSSLFEGLKVLTIYYGGDSGTEDDILAISKVNPAVKKTVGCVHSELLMDFLFYFSDRTSRS